MVVSLTWTQTEDRLRCPPSARRVDGKQDDNDDDDDGSLDVNTTVHRAAKIHCMDRERERDRDV